MGEAHNNNETVLSELKGFLSSSKERFDKYFDLVSTQMKIVFVVYMVLAVTGFIVLVIGIGISFIIQDNTIKIVVSASGILTEFIAQILLVIYNATVKNYQNYSNNLFQTQKFIYSTNLIDQVKEDKTRDVLIHKIFEYLTDWYEVTGQKGKVDSGTNKK